MGVLVKDHRLSAGLLSPEPFSLKRRSSPRFGGYSFPGGSFMNINSLLTPIPYGLMELDETGTVIYYRSENKGLFARPESEIVGRNFFTDIAAVMEAKEFQNRIKEFRRSHTPAYSFTFTFTLKHRSLPVRVLLARIHERSTVNGQKSSESLYIHIRPQADNMAA
jgi:photoactive yellow protein